MKTIILKAKRAYWEATGRQYLHFLHVGKTAGSSLKLLIQEAHTTEKYRPKMHDHGTRLRDIPSQDAVGFFVRDPIERFISAFHHHLREGRPDYYVPNTLAQNMGFTLFPAVEDLVNGLCYGDTKERQLAEWTIQANEHLSRPLTHWFSKEELQQRKEQIAFVGDQKNFNQDLKRLEGLLGVEFSETPTKHMSAGKNPSLQDENLQTALRDYLAADYEIYDYLISEYGLG